MNTQREQIRSASLEWWRNISIEAKIDYVKSWQKSLPIHGYSTARYWSFELIDCSSAHIQQVYEFIKSCK